MAWIIAEAIPFFSDLLSISSSLFISGFTFYLPALMWFMLLREGSLFEKKNIVRTLANGGCFIIGVVVLVCGTYASIADIVSTPPIWTYIQNVPMLTNALRSPSIMMALCAAPSRVDPLSKHQLRDMNLHRGVISGKRFCTILMQHARCGDSRASLFNSLSIISSEEHPRKDPLLSM